jgi:hypothetical protein
MEIKMTNQKYTATEEHVEILLNTDNKVSRAIETFKNAFKREGFKPNGEIVNTIEGMEIDFEYPTLYLTIAVEWEWDYDFGPDYETIKETSVITIESHGTWVSIEY